MNDDIQMEELLDADLRYYVNIHNTWTHFRDHVLNNKGEWDSWAVLIPELHEAIGAGRRMGLLALAGESVQDQPPENLQSMWLAFQRLVERELANDRERLKWVWMVYNTNENRVEGRILTHKGLLYFVTRSSNSTELLVRTGFLPHQDGGLRTEPPQSLREYDLFKKCWDKVRRRHYRAFLNQNNLLCCTDEFRDLMEQTVPSYRDWLALAPGEGGRQ